MTVKTSGQARVGWCTSNYAPESNYVGCGSDQDSWGWDGSQLKAYYDEKKNAGGKTYGEYWAVYVLLFHPFFLFFLSCS
jgi:hypothetical protein